MPEWARRWTPLSITSLSSYQLSTYILYKLLPWSMSSLVPVSYQQLTRFLPGEKQYLILAITLYRVGTCISSMPPPSALVNTHHSYESIILSSYSLATCFLFHMSSIFLMHQSIESPGGGGRDGAGIVHRPSALFCIVPAPRGTFFCH